MCFNITCSRLFSRRTKMKWTEGDTYTFIGLYRDYECLWNMSSANYKNKHTRQRAIEAIMQAMGREEFGVIDVKQKIKNIRSTYNQEVQKIQKSKTSGTSPDDVYKPTSGWCHGSDYESFIGTM